MIKKLTTGWRFPTWILNVLLLFPPLLVAVIWGSYFPDRAYRSFQYAQSLTDYQPVGDHAPLLQAPLWNGLLLIAAAIEISLPELGLILSGLGWGVTAVIFHALMRLAGSQAQSSLLPAILLLFNPIFVSILGTEIPWLIALWGVLFILAVESRWSRQTIALFLLLGLSFDLSTLFMAILLLGIRWRVTKQFPRRPFGGIGLVVLGWVAIAVWQVDGMFMQPGINLLAWTNPIDKLLLESEFYWLFLPFSALGLFAITNAGRMVSGLPLTLNPTTPLFILSSIVWGGLLLLSDGLAGAAVLTAVGLLLVGLGVDWVIRTLQWRKIVLIEPGQLSTSVTLVAIVPLLFAQSMSLWQRYQLRPATLMQLEEEAGRWLHQNTEPREVLFGSARLGYLAGRPIWNREGSGGDEVEFSRLTGPLVQDPPDVVALPNTLAWSEFMGTEWFLERYQQIQQFSSAYESASPLTIWRYRETAYDKGVQHSVDVRTENGMELVAYQYWPEEIDPGGAIYVTLYWQTTEPISVAQDNSARLISPVDHAVWAQRGKHVPRSFPPSWIQLGETFEERIVLTTTQEISVGAYQLNASLYTLRSEQFAALYQNNDTNPLDQILLGWVVVPWRGSTEAAVPLDATFGDQIRLPFFELEGDQTAGGELSVTLYWEGIRPPDGDYTVFVHLLDTEKQLVANHDGLPRGGYYSSLAWRPDHLVPDTHPIVLPSELPPGNYEISVGLYLPETGVRLPVTDSGGNVQPDHAIRLSSIEISE